MANQFTTTKVSLQTLVVRLRNGNKEKIVRAIIDTGSENSYVTKDIIDFLKYVSIDEMKLVHKLFGGVETKERVHHKYEINVSSVDNSYKCNLYCFHQPIICSGIRKITHGPWISELRKFGISITDLENEIKLLIGSDVAGKLYTGNIKLLQSGPVTMQTRLGWVLMGKITSKKLDETNNALVVTNLFLKNCSLADLWKLEMIGINDPIESKTKAEINQETMQHFQNTLNVDSDGRYEVALPWVLENSRLPNNKELAKKRLATTKRKLADSNKTDVYQAVFGSWLSENIIEEIFHEKESNVNYLPHRPIFKATSETTKVRPFFDASTHVEG